MFGDIFEELFHKTDFEKLCSLCDRSSIWSKDTKRMKKLLNESVGLEIDALDEVGMAPLHYAISNRYHEAIDLLLKYGANPRLVDGRGTNPLGYAFKLHYQKHNEDSRKIVIKLIKAGILANIMTVKMLISYYQFDEEILEALFSEERTIRGFNKGHMIDVNMLMKMMKKKGASRIVMKLLFSFKPNLHTKTTDLGVSTKNDNLVKIENQLQKRRDDLKKNEISQLLIGAITDHMKKPKTSKIIEIR